MICLAELASVRHHNIPLKIFLFNNHCHGIQKQTLETWLGGRNVGVDPDSGVVFPQNWGDVAEAFGLKVLTINNMQSADIILAEIYANNDPCFINVEINPDQKLYPVLKFGDALENQLPSQDGIDMNNEMIIPVFMGKINPDVVVDKSSQGW